MRQRYLVYGRPDWQLRIGSRRGRKTFIYAIGRKATGIGDCAGIGTGPGVHCVFNVPWPEFEETGPWRGYPIVLPWKDRTLDPAIFLFGLDPENPGIRYLAVDSQSIAEEAWGF